MEDSTWLLALKDSTSSSEWVGAGQVPGEGHGSSSVSSTQLQVSRQAASPGAWGQAVLQEQRGENPA